MRAFLVSRLVFFEPEEAMGEVVGAEAPAVSWTELECMEMAEAAEQLIQLSSSCDDGGGGESSESRSTESVKCRKAAVGEHRGNKEVAAESSAARRCGSFGAEKDNGDDEAVFGGGARRMKPRFRTLATIYRETARLSGDGCRGAEEDEMRRKRKRKRKRASDAAADVEVIRPAACMPRRLVES